ncbi:MAG: hypothetical protein JST54_25325 [Deltaproteobacteria bacterium]|nr:hypothetical protein [Deltaproteobacteria bacterium]
MVGKRREPTHLALDEERMLGAIIAAAEMLQARACEAIEGVAPLIEMWIPALGVEAFAIFLQRAKGDDIVTVFNRRSDYELFRTGVQELAEGRTSTAIPRHLAFNPEPARRVTSRHRSLNGKERLAIHGLKKLPSPVALSDGHDAITNHELMILEATARALTELAKELRARREPNLDGEDIDRTVVIAVEDSKVEVRLRPCTRPKTVEAVDGTFDLRAARWGEGNRLRSEWVTAFNDEVVRRFVESSRKRAVPRDGRWIRTILQHARTFTGLPLGMIEAAALRYLVFEIVPNQLSCEPAHAAALVNELRDFYRWAKEEHGFEPADTCLAMLHPDVELALANVLHAEWNNPSYALLVETARRMGVHITGPLGVKEFVNTQFESGDLETVIHTLYKVFHEKSDEAPPRRKSKRKKTAH